MERTGRRLSCLTPRPGHIGVFENVHFHPGGTKVVIFALYVICSGSGGKMSTPRKLTVKRIAVLAANGFEQVELERAVATLTQAGAMVAVVALHPGRIRGVRMHQSAELVRVDHTIDDVQVDDYDGLLIPGGCACPDMLRQSALARSFVRQFDQARKPIALLSQAPLVLVSAGLAKNRTLTSWPGVRDDIVNAGATWLNQPIVCDANYLSCRSSQDIELFLGELVPFFEGESRTTSPLLKAQSDPPQEKPAELQNQSLRWLAAPSVGAMLSLALLGVGVVAAQHARHKPSESDGDNAPAP
jgi:protease I